MGFLLCLCDVMLKNDCQMPLYSNISMRFAASPTAVAANFAGYWWCPSIIHIDGDKDMLALSCLS